MSKLKQMNTPIFWAETIQRDRTVDRFSIRSAGTQPTEIKPMAIRVLREKNIYIWIEIGAYRKICRGGFRLHDHIMRPRRGKLLYIPRHRNPFALGIRRSR